MIKETQDERVKRELIGLVQKILKRPNLEVNSSESLQVISGWDSLNALSLLLSIEEMYSFQLDPGEMGKYETINELVNVVISKKA